MNASIDAIDAKRIQSRLCSLLTSVEAAIDRGVFLVDLGPLRDQLAELLAIAGGNGFTVPEARPVEQSLDSAITRIAQLLRTGSTLTIVGEYEPFIPIDAPPKSTDDD